ncbi:preprotein translocase subunit YajC [Microbacterium sp. G2-8]|uniref:preprotein translocase subunit YajC n=1 Tax=Microbacterium sp. G2-8 TaxID=2842454 RepID=UPI001C8A0180|nr:preprotein translocase subunit YajC [Microbacterium sp. G2-8]
MDPNILLLVIAGALLVFMFWSSSRRRKKMQAEEQRRQQLLVPGAAVMTRAGLYGTLVSFDADDLTQHAVIQIAPGVEVEVHAQTVTLDPEAEQEDVYDEDDEVEDDVDEIVEPEIAIEGVDEPAETRRDEDDTKKD